MIIGRCISRVSAASVIKYPMRSTKTVFLVDTDYVFHPLFGIR